MIKVHVAVGVVINTKKEIFLAKRDVKAHQGGLWEFPGGKVEADENVSEALARELKEELGISLTASKPLIDIHHDYGDKQVLLDVYLVTEFEGEPSGVEGQPTCWVRAEQLDDYEFPAANTQIVETLKKHPLLK